MANICLTNYIVTGKESELRDLYSKMEFANESENALDISYCYFLVTTLGCEYPDFYCRGDFYDVFIEEKEGEPPYLSFVIESAWRELSEWRAFINSKYPHLKFYFIAEEYGEDIFETNDKDHKYFVDKYILHIDGDNEYFRFDEQEDIVKRINGATNLNVKTFDECLALSDTLDSDDPNYFRIRVIDYVD